MPLTHLALMLFAVLIAAAISVSLLLAGGPGILAVALPAFLIAALAMKVFRR